MKTVQKSDKLIVEILAQQKGDAIDASSRIFMSDSDVLAAIALWDGPIIVDFDETLLHRNSTEEFLDCAAPGLAGAVTLKILDLTSPWRWTGGAATRDVWRVRTVRLLFPATARRWQRACAKKAELVNAPLLNALRDKPFIVASNGFRPIIAPLLAAMKLGETRLIACNPNRMIDRTGGKTALIETALGPDALSAALFVTDSVDDAATLERCAKPCLTRWQGAKFLRAGRQIYLPGDYLTYVKRPLQNGALRRLVTDDLLLWLLIFSPTWPDALTTAGICMMFLSLWSVYETGYRDNDACAAKYEPDPVLSTAYAAFDTAHFEAKGWISAVSLGTAGLLALQPPAIAAAGLKWLAVLLGLRGTYWIYNRIDKATRVWLYIALHVFRTLALVAILPAGIIGIIAGVTQIFARWQEYFLYRFAAGSHWPETRVRLVQFLFFAVCIMAMACAGRDILSWRMACLLAWSIFLARKDFLPVWRAAHRIDRSNR